jgi:hypothetical protein
MTVGVSSTVDSGVPDAATEAAWEGSLPLDGASLADGEVEITEEMDLAEVVGLDA